MAERKVRDLLRQIAGSRWTALSIGTAVVLLHGMWYLRTQHHADVISGFGVSVSVLGILITTQPFIRRGVRKTARREYNLTSQERLEEIREQADELEEVAVRHVLEERVIGVALIAVGTLLNGYAPTLERLLP